MLKKYFLETTLSLFKATAPLYPYLQMLYKYLAHFKKDCNFKVDGVEGSFSILIDNNQEYMDMSIYNDSINIRTNYSEFYYFTDQITTAEFDILLSNLFKGNYSLNSFVNNNLIEKQDLIFDNPDLAAFNQQDIYGKKKEVIMQTKRGFNWLGN
jgi:hypothetical protein